MINVFDGIQSVGGVTIGSDSFFEIRIENDGNGNPIYVARSPNPNASPSEKIWYIIKLHYENGFLVRVEQPTMGRGYLYAWDLRYQYFS